MTMRRHLLAQIYTQYTPVMLTEDITVGDMTQYLNHGSIVAWLFHDIVFGTITDGAIRIRNRRGVMDPKAIDRYLERARLFNDNREIYLFRGKNNVMQGRIREDFVVPEEGHTQRVHVKEVEMLLLGRHEEFVDQDWVRLSSQRGSIFIIPMQWSKGSRDRIVVHMRYYMGYVNHLASIVDQRIVRIGR